MRFRGMRLALLVAVVAGAAGALAGFRAGVADTMHMMIGNANEWQRKVYAIRYAVGLEGFGGIYGQDLWILHALYPGVKDGFFVDVGSADGVVISNSRRLEEAGWTGVCIDPFPRNMGGRTCKVFDEVVDAEAGNTVQFHSPGTYGGGILRYAGWWLPEGAKSKYVELKTTTIGDILQRANAPAFIHYLNVDIEGAEYEALKVFPFDRYRLGAITVEHNNLEDRRLALRSLLEHHGYRLEWSIRDQDWYRPRAAASQSQ